MTASAVTSSLASTNPNPNPNPVPPGQSVSTRGGERETMPPVVSSYLRDADAQSRSRPTMNAQGQLIGQIINVSA